jgi:hypothetical protein
VSSVKGSIGPDPARSPDERTFVHLRGAQRRGYAADTLIGGEGDDTLDGGYAYRGLLPANAMIANPLRRGDRIEGNGGDDVLLRGGARLPEAAELRLRPRAPARAITLASCLESRS